MRAAAVKQWVCNRAYLLLSLGVTLAGLTSARPAFAQVGAGTLTGQVTDVQDRKPLADVVVTATSPDLQGEQVVVTDSSGLYRIPSLPAGTYSIHFEKDGYKIIDRTGIALRTDATLRVDAPLLPESLKAEEVVVTARAPTVDVGSSAIATTITKDFTSRIPVAHPTGKGGANRSIEAVAEVVPGAQGDDFGVSFAGSSSPENSYLVDGLNVGNPGYGTIGTPLSIEFVKELSVITGGYMPEYGRTTGGMISAITKSGSNELHGNVFANWAPGGLAGTPTTPPVGVGAATMTNPLDWLGDVGGDVGGPIAKDKLWFYAGFDVSSENYNIKRQFYRQIPTAANLSQALNVNCDQPGYPPCPQTERIAGADQSNAARALSFQAIAKLTWAINENNKVTGTFVASPTHSGGTGKFGVSPLKGGPQTELYPNGTLESTALQTNSESYDASLRWSSEFKNKRVLLDTTFGFHHEVDSEYPSDGSQFGSAGLINQPNVNWNRTAVPGQPLVGYHSITEFENNSALSTACAVPPDLVMYTNTLCPVPQYSSGGPVGQSAHLYTQTYDRYSASSTATYLLQFLGHHILKAGASVEFTTSTQVVGSAKLSEDGSGGFLSQDAGFGVLNGPDNPISGNPLHIKTKSVVVGGFLQDSWSIMDVVTANFGFRYDTQQLYNGLGQTTMSLPDQWSPRVGVIYDPTQTGRAKIYANYARYYESVPLALANDSLVGEPNVLAQFPGPGSDVANCNSVPHPQSCTSLPRNPNVNPPAQPSQTFHVQGQGIDSIDPNVRPTTEDDFVAGGEYEIFKDARAGISYQRRWLVRWLDDMSNDATSTFFLGNPGYGWASGFPQAERTYDAGTVYLTKAFGNEWLTSASYTLSYLRGNVAGQFLPGAANEFDPNHNASFDTKAFTINQQGPLDGDRTHQLKLFGAKDWMINLQNRLSTGLSFRAMSGTPINYLANDAIYGCCGLNLLLPRGSGGRTPWEYDVDVNLGYRFVVNKDTTLTATLDIFNLLNFQAVELLNMNYTNQNALGQQNGTLAQARVFSNGVGRPIYSSDKNPDFLRADTYQSPRYFRFGLRGTF